MQPEISLPPSFTRSQESLPAFASVPYSQSLGDLDKREPTGVPSVSYNLFVSDTKTRFGASLPPPEDSIGSKIQLMLYHRLLNELLSTSPSFDFASFWSRLGVNPSRSFSKKFLAEARFPPGSNASPMSCLDGLSQAFLDQIQEMSIAGVDPTLEIIYRSRASKKEKESQLAHLNASEEIAASLKVEIGLKEFVPFELLR